jgi:CRISPR/Cas system endoribonuclease Cas6 (RAMP superfamily)
MVPQKDGEEITIGLDLELVAKTLLRQQKSAPQGLKPKFYAAPTARLKPCPFKTRFMQPVLYYWHAPEPLQVCGEVH